MVELNEIITKIDELLPKLDLFIVQFNQLLLTNPVNIIVDASGFMSADISTSMPNTEADLLAKRIGVLDRLVITQSQEVDSLLDKGKEIEAKFFQEHTKFTSRILEKAKEFEIIRDKRLFKS
jgi:hypothetical protein